MQAAQRLMISIYPITLGCMSGHAVLSFFGYHIHSKFGSTNACETRIPPAPRRIWRCTRQPKTFDHPGLGRPTKTQKKRCRMQGERSGSLTFVCFQNRGTPKSSILIGFSIINPSILGYPYFWKHPFIYPVFKDSIFRQPC